MRKVLIVTYYWPPSGGAGVQRWLKFTKYLPDLGIKPFVVTVDKDSASYPVIDESLEKDIHPEVTVVRTKTTEPFDFYKKFTRRKQIPFAGFANDRKEKFSQKVFRFIRGNFFIPDARKGWNAHALKACREIIEREKIDVIITSSPPHSTQLIGIKLKQLFPGIKWIADLRDPWTDIYYYSKLLHTPVAKEIDRRLEKKVIEACDEAIVVSHFIKQQFLKKSSAIAETKFHVIPNGFDEEDFAGRDTTKEPAFLLTYTGTVSPDYPVFEFAQAFRIVASKSNIRLRFVGAVPGVIKNLFEGLPVEFIPHVEHSVAIQFMCSSTALLLMIPNARDNKGILTGKLFEYLAARTPIFFIGPKDGDAAEIIRSAKAGYICEPGNVNEIAEQLLKLTSEWTSIAPVNTEKYSRKALTGQLAQLLASSSSHHDKRR